VDWVRILKTQGDEPLRKEIETVKTGETK